MRNCFLEIKQRLEKINISNIFDKVTFNKTLQLFVLNMNNYKFPNVYIIKIKKCYFSILQIENSINSKHITQISNNKVENCVLTNLQSTISIIIIK